MKEYYSKTNKKSGRLSLVLVMLLCAAMIGASCWFAYTQTAKEITLDLNSVLEEGQLAANAPETALPRPAATTVRPTEPPATKPPAATAPPENRAAAVIYAPSQTTETVTETIALAVTSRRYPAEGDLMQPYSGGELVKSPTTGVWQTHNGMDIAAALGDAVYPVEAGIVCAVKDDALWGICVTIDHRNGYFSRYCGLNAGLNVSEGDEVTITDAIGAVGDTADVESAMESHLHFEVLQGEHYIDPVAYIEE